MGRPICFDRGSHPGAQRRRLRSARFSCQGPAPSENKPDCGRASGSTALLGDRIGFTPSGCSPLPWCRRVASPSCPALGGSFCGVPREVPCVNSMVSTPACPLGDPTAPPRTLQHLMASPCSSGCRCVGCRAPVNADGAGVESAQCGVESLSDRPMNNRGRASDSCVKHS